MEEDELLDLVDSNDQVIGTIMRSQYAHMVSNKLGYIRSADAFIINDKGELWIPRRREYKKIAPSGLDYSMGEHVQSGESFEEACVRGFKEELNMVITPTDLALLTKFKPEEIAYIQTLFLYHSNKTPDYNKDDFSEYFWMTPGELIKKLNGGEPAKTSLIRSAKYIQEYLKTS